MIVIGIDPHKSTHTATVVDAHTNKDLASLRIDATLKDYRRLLKWAQAWPQRRWAVENAEGLGRHLSSWLLARSEDVVDVPATATARIRQLSRGGRRKNDRIDAAAAASVAALQGDARSVQPEDHTDALALLDERRSNLAGARVRTVNQLHGLFRSLLVGGAPTELTTDAAQGLLRKVKPTSAAEKVRKDLAKELIADLRRQDKQLESNATEMSELLEETSTSLPQTPGIGPVTASRILGRTGPAHRFRTAAAFANYTGTAPVEVASADKSRHRLSRFGDRQLNSAIHTVAVTQIRMTSSKGHSYYRRKIDEGKTPKEAKRCLKRQLANHIWSTMIADERRLQSAVSNTAPTAA